MSETECNWTCKTCGTNNVEYEPFPVIAECESCGAPESDYCSHVQENTQ